MEALNNWHFGFSGWLHREVFSELGFYPLVVNGKPLRLYASDYIMNKSITILWVRTKQHNIAIELGKYLIESPRITRLTVDNDIFTEAWVKFQKA